MSRPRIDPDDFIDVAQLMEGEWYRTPMYGGEGHMSDGTNNAYCTRIFNKPDFYDGLREHVRLATGKDKLGDYFLAIDRRKGSKCSVCKTKHKDLQSRNKIAPADPVPLRCTCPSSPPFGLDNHAKWLANLNKFEIIRAMLGGTWICEKHDDV